MYENVKTTYNKIHREYILMLWFLELEKTICNHSTCMLTMLAW